MSLTKVSQEIISGFEAETYTELTTPPAYGSNPAKGGLQFYANNTANQEKVFASIQTEIQTATAGAEEGRLHFLVNDGNFLQPIGTIDRDGSWIFGPGAPPYIMNIAGVQTVNAVPGSGPIFGERLSVEDPDYEDARVLALRNLKVTDLNSLSYRAGMGFSILNTAGKERPTGYLRVQYSDRTANSEDSYMYPTTLANGVQIDGPYFADGGIGFQLQGGALLPANRLGAYEEGTWTPSFEGASGAITGSWGVGPFGNYVVVGNLLFVSFYGFMASPATYPTGQVLVSGLPFVIKYGPNGRYQSLQSSYVTPGVSVSANGYRWQAGGSDEALLHSATGIVNWGSGSAIELGGSGIFELA